MTSIPRPRSVASFLVAALVWSWASPVARAQSASTGDERFRQAVELFEVWLDAKMAYERIPGVSVGLVHDRALAWAEGYGWADLEARVPATPSTLYSVCSISKLFTSIAVMQRRDAGDLRLDDGIADLLPWYDVEQSHRDGPRVSVQGVLTHSSGLPRESDHPYWTGPYFSFPTRDEVIEGLGRQRTLYPGDRYFQYSNLGMTLAGQIVEETSGLSYDDYVRARILDPLGMSDTYTDIPSDRAGGRLAQGYTRLDRSGERREASLFRARGIAPAAGYASTVEDLARFVAWQFRLLEDGGEEVLDVNTLREMHRVHWVDPDFETMWGLGFAVSRRDGERAVGHGGSCPGFRSTVQLALDRDVGGVVLINAQGTSPDDVWSKMESVLVPALAAIEDDPAGSVARPAELAEYAGRYESTWGETAILRWDDGLAAVSLPTDDPMESMRRLRRQRGDVFRRVRADGELGEEYVFERDAEEAVTRLVVHGNRSRKVR